MRFIVTCASILITAVAGVMLFARAHWLFDVVATYVPQLALASLVLLVVLFVMKRFALLAIVFVMAALIAWPMIFFWLAPSHASKDFNEDATGITVLEANVNSRNTETIRLIEMIKHEEPDIVVLIEATPRWVDALIESLGAVYPYVRDDSADDYRGIAIFSKHSIASVESLGFRPATPPALVAQIENPALTVVALHAMPPVSEELARERNDFFQFLVEPLAVMDEPLIVAGDFNAAVTSPWLRDFVRDAGLTSAREGFGWKPSWMRGSLVAAAIDHILYRGQGVTVKKFRTLGDIGSDHVPIVAELEIVL